MITYPISTIIFDLDGTLRHNVPSADDTQYGFVLDLGIKDEPGRQRKGTYWQHYYWAQSPELIADIDSFGNGESPDFWEQYSFRYLQALEVPERKASDLAFELFRRMQSEFHPESRVLPEGMETLQHLKEAGFILGLVSNRTKACHAELEELGILHFFEFAYVAGEVEAWKPNPKIFDRTLELTGANPAQIVYVGDNYFADIVGAKDAGLQPVLIDPKGIFSAADCTVIQKIDQLINIVTP
jgi:HAD superfamily hydrolase (TIGR01549 family)